MGQRRKGEQSIQRTVAEWTDRHPVDRAIATGSRWFYAWMAQEATPTVRLAKRTGIPAERLREIECGASFTRVELEALAAAWWITPEGLLASIPDRSLVTDH